jgi:hypothetical protein
MTALPEGPWTIEPGANSHRFDARIMAGGACIAFAEGDVIRDDDGDIVGIEPSSATRAMAAAYDLLKAAEEFLEFFQNNDDDLAIGEEIRLQENLRAAIAKARGGAV